MKPPLAVLDASVFVSALLRPSGAPGRLLQRLPRDRGFELVVSPPILRAIRRSLDYPRAGPSIFTTTPVGSPGWQIAVKPEG